jgi:hypothetical protein
VVLGAGGWGIGPTPQSQSPIPNPQSPIPNPQYKYIYINFIKILDKTDLFIIKK